MERVNVLVRRCVAFGALAVVAGTLVALRGPGTTSVVAETALPETFPGFEPDQVFSFEVARTKKDGDKTVPESIRIARADTSPGHEAWAVETASRYPAKLGVVKEYLAKVKEARTRGEKTRTASRFPQYAPPEGFTEVRLFDKDARAIVSFGIGKSGADGNWSDVFLRLDDAKKASPGAGEGSRVVAATKAPSTFPGTGVTEWIDTALWPGVSETEVATLVVDQREKSRVVEMVRVPKTGEEKDDTWKVTKPEEGKASSTGSNLVRTFVGLNLTEMVESAGGAEADAKYGFDKPTVVVTTKSKTEKPGQTPVERTLTIGKKVEGKEQWYVRRGEEPWVFTVSEWEVKLFREEPSAWIEKKPEPPPSNGDGTAMGEAPPAMDGAAPPAMGEAPPPAMGEAPPPAMGEAPPPAMGEAPPAPMGEAPPPAMEDSPMGPPPPPPQEPPPAPMGDGK
jgi:hypothetical protein